MKVSEAIKDWGTLKEFVYDRVSGKDKSRLTDKDYDVLNEAASKIVGTLDIPDVSEDAKKIMALNILDKKVSFDIFDKVPPLWYAYYGTSIYVVASGE